MEHPAALAAGGGVYRWHAGAPDDGAYGRARAELIERIEAGLTALGAPALELDAAPEASEAGPSASPPGRAGERRQDAAPPRGRLEFVVAAFGEEALRLALEHEHVVVTGRGSRPTVVSRRSRSSADQFLENGIAEQDMVSAAAGLARHGLLPIVNSFASFLASRANEQIYNQASERSKVVTAPPLRASSRRVPGSPTRASATSRCSALSRTSLSSTRATAPRAQAMLRWAPSGVGRERRHPPRHRPVAQSARPRRHDRPGRGTLLHPGDDALLIAYGPVMLAEAMGAAERLSEEGVSLAVVAMPWLSRIDGEWAAGSSSPYPELHVLEDHAPVGALSDALLRALQPERLARGSSVARPGRRGVAGVRHSAGGAGPPGLDAASLCCARNRAGAAVTRPWAVG